MLWILIAIAAIAISYVFLSRPHQYWLKKGVKQGKPVFLLGDSWGTILKTHSLIDMVQMVYNISRTSRYCGFYQFLKPTLILRDPDLIKQITVKDFDHFVNHSSFIPDDIDPLWNKNLFSLKDHKWRDMRSTLSPAFTSSKIKFMFSLISDTGEQFVKYFLKQDKNVITVEMKETFTRFTNDVIANTAFGVKCDSLSERDNEFYVMGKEATDFSGFWKTIKFLGYFIIPQIYKYLNVTFFSENVGNFFKRVVRENIAIREKQGIVRPDMIHLLMEAKKYGLKREETEPVQDAGFATVEEINLEKAASVKQELTDEDITAQALIFFFGGFDSVSSLMCFMSYELSLNPDIQQRLIEEVDETLENCKGRLTYEVLIKMKYLDMVASESLRKWPNNVAVDRVCTKPYTIEPKTADEKSVHLSKGDELWLPIFALHRDPKHFPDPDRFDPERFNDENKNKINPYAYIPFGSGPRNCIGSRFALLETKALFVHILSHFEIVTVDKTEIPLKLNKKSFMVTAENGFWLGLKRRNHLHFK